MWLRRGLYRSLWVAAVVLPLWVLLGRAFFGAPLGYQFLAQIILVPILFVVQVVALGIVFLRPSNRRRRAVSGLDAGLIALTWSGQLALGFFLVDSAASRSAASAFSAVAGDRSVSLSNALTAVSIIVILAAGAGLLVGGLWQTVNDAKAGFRATLADMDRVVQGASAGSQAAAPAAFAADPEHTIRITPRA